MKVKKISSEAFENFRFFYGFLGWRMGATVISNLLVGLLDGVGLAFFLPLLQSIDGKGIRSATSTGFSRTITSIFDTLGIDYGVISIVILMGLVFLVKAGIKFISSLITLRNLQLFLKKIRDRCISGVFGMQYATFNIYTPGEIQSVVGSEIDSLLNAYRSYFMILQYVVMISVYMFLALLSNPKFTILVIILGGVTNLFYKKLYIKTKESSKEINKLSHRMQNQLIQAIQSYKYIKGTGQNALIKDRLLATTDLIRQKVYDLGFLRATVETIREPMVILVLIILIIVEVTFFSGTVSAMVLSLLFFYRALSFTVALQSQQNTFIANTGSLTHVTEFIDKVTKERELTEGDIFSNPLDKIDIRNLSFGYGNQAVLQKVSVTFEKGKSYGLIGDSGSGKTTLFSIILGLYPEVNDHIKVNGLPLTDVDLLSYRQRFGYISQDSVVFADTLFNNVTMWDDATSDNLIRFTDAIERASLTKYYQSIESNPHHLLTANGGNLSGGQKQRVNIARELYRNVDIILLDEATSALDIQTEREIQENIEILSKKGITTLIIAHRLATVKHVDYVLHFTNRGIDIYSGFEEAMMVSQNFATIVNKQQLL